jgi:hypothetical protein
VIGDKRKEITYHPSLITYHRFYCQPSRRREASIKVRIENPGGARSWSFDDIYGLKTDAKTIYAGASIVGAGASFLHVGWKQ